VLVCGLTGLKAEDLKALRRAVKQLGFQCRMEKGWLNFVPFPLREGKEDWQSLFKLLNVERSIIPLYFEEEGKVIDLEYGKFCSQVNGLELLCKLILMGWSRTLLSRGKMTALAIGNSKKEE